MAKRVTKSAERLWEFHWNDGMLILVFHQNVGMFTMVVIVSTEGGTDGRAEL